MCGIHEVQDFMQIAFDKKIAPSSVSEILHEMGFSSHRPGPLSYRFGGRTDADEAIRFLKGVQQTLKKKVHSHEIERIVAIDQISFWDCGIVTSTYSPIGGCEPIVQRSHSSDFNGQPRLWDSDVGSKHIVYEAFCADGSCLPPVIFVPEPVKGGADYYTPSGHHAILIHLAGLGAPSSESTLLWLKRVTRLRAHYFEDNPHIILDSLRGHFTAEMEEAWQNVNATTHRLPAALGRWLDPCDQSINREMRREFIRLQTRDRKCKLDNIIDAYYSIKDETVKNAFIKCGYLGRDAEEVIRTAESEGYRATRGRSADMARYKTAFIEWASRSTRDQRDVLPRSAPPEQLESTLDGAQWARYGTSQRRRVGQKM